MTEIGRSITELDTPFLWVDLDQLERNIEALSRHISSAGVQWRPHVKGLKTPEIAQRALAAGAIGVTCAKLGEAEVMAAAGIHDILIANQIVGPIKAQRLARLCRVARVMVAVDDAHNVAQLGAAATAHGVTTGVLVDVNIGMERTGVAPGDAALRLSRVVSETPGLRYCGLMGWEGQATTLTDAAERERVVRQAIAQLAATAALCREAGLPVEVVSAGGSVTLDTTPFLSGVTEIQAGGAAFCDVYYRQMQSVTSPALFVRSAISSRPAPNRLTFDAGFKALPPWKRTPEPLSLPNVASISFSAEHGAVILRAPDESIRIGDAYDFIVGYGDQTVFLHDTLYGIRGGAVEAVWDVRARGKLT